MNYFIIIIIFILNSYSQCFNFKNNISSKFNASSMLSSTDNNNNNNRQWNQIKLTEPSSTKNTPFDISTITTSQNLDTSSFLHLETTTIMLGNTTFSNSVYTKKSVDADDDILYGLLDDDDDDDDDEYDDDDEDEERDEDVVKVDEDQLDNVEEQSEAVEENVENDADYESFAETKPPIILKSKLQKKKVEKKHGKKHGVIKIKKFKKLKKFMLPLLIAYKLKFFALVPLLIKGLFMIMATTGFAGFFFALFAVGLGTKHK